MNPTLDIPGLCRLTLRADGPEADALVARCAALAGLDQAHPAGSDVVITCRPFRHGTSAPLFRLGALRFAISGDSTICFCDVGENTDLDEMVTSIFLVLALRLQQAGALLLHGALAERHGSGVLLAAPSGTGKSTASRRLPAPWRSLCDDTSVIVGDGTGFRAHPWPTMGEVREGRHAGGWAVEHGVPLDGIFLLAQSTVGDLRPVGPGAGLCSLVHLERQASWLIDATVGEGGLRERRLDRFDRLAALASTVPSFRLGLTLRTPFWLDIEKALASDARQAAGVAG